MKTISNETKNYYLAKLSYNDYLITDDVNDVPSYYMQLETMCAETIEDVKQYAAHLINSYGHNVRLLTNVGI